MASDGVKGWGSNQRSAVSLRKKTRAGYHERQPVQRHKRRAVCRGDTPVLAQRYKTGDGKTKKCSPVGNGHRPMHRGSKIIGGQRSVPFDKTKAPAIFVSSGLFIFGFPQNPIRKSFHFAFVGGGAGLTTDHCLYRASKLNNRLLSGVIHRSVIAANWSVGTRSLLHFS